MNLSSLALRIFPFYALNKLNFDETPSIIEERLM